MDKHNQSVCSHIINIYSKQQKPPQDRGNLYLSGVDALEDVELMKANHINCVLTIINKWTYQNYQVSQLIQNAQIKHRKWIDLRDDHDSNETYEYIKEMLAYHNILVHCQMGMSRSSSIVIAFLMRECGMGYHAAKMFTKGKRKIVQPNEGFQRDLLKFQQSLKKDHPQLFKASQ